MRQRMIGLKITFTGVAMLLAIPLMACPAWAEQPPHLASVQSYASGQTTHPVVVKAQAPGVTKSHIVAKIQQTALKAQPRVARAGGISCVPFARLESGIVVGGNAWQWWGNAAGLYARGFAPEPGSVLAFRANGRMRLGHVAVVARVINAREVLIDHANWPNAGSYGGISEAIPVVDVSEANDWSAVRVGLGRTAEFGAIYPTYGFIYDRPDTGTMEASRRAPAPQVAEINPPRRDLRYEEVAEAPHPSRRPAAR